MMMLIEILMLCGTAQMVVISHSFAPLRAIVSAKFGKCMIVNAQCAGFWAGIITYSTVACCAIVAPETNFGFPLAEIVAGMHGCIRWGLVFLLGGLISLCIILVNQVVEILGDYQCWLVCEIERHRIAKQLLHKELTQKSRKRDND